MPGASDREHPIPVRRFTGTILSMDPAFVPPGFLTFCNNWVPDPTFVLTKRRGSQSWQQLPAGIDDVDNLVFNLGSDGHRYLFAMACASGGDKLYVSVDDGTFTAVTNGAFATPSERYGIVAVGDTVYAGNDADPIKYVHLGDAAVDLVPLALADDTGQTATFLDDPNSNLLAGTYSYRWAVYDNTTLRWVKIANVRTVTTPSASRQRLSFRAPTAGLATGQSWHLFVAGVDQMIEGAHDQLPNGAPAGGSDVFALYDDPDVNTSVVPIPSTVQRHGSHLCVHRGCLYGAGGPGVEGRRAWATSVLVPGLEQQTQDQGLFFPATALTRDLGDTVSGLTVVPQSSGAMQPSAPLAIFTPVSTWLWQGDLSYDDPGASLSQISAEIGCPSDRTIVATTVGVIFCGKRSVYLLSPANTEPRDIGWPIESAIRNIPPEDRVLSWAVFHRGFYKLAISQAGEVIPLHQWWLDLRHGLDDPPAWWGPHSTPAYTASTRVQSHPDEDDRQWAALGAGQILLLDQADRYVEDGVPPVPIASRMISAYLDDGTPLIPKIAKRARVIARVEAPTSLVVTVSGDEALSASGVLPLTVPTAGIWNTSAWNTAQWAVSALDLVEFELPVPELRARAFQAIIEHTDPIRCDLRDFELRVQPSARETR
jgi:hypothetical protein